MVEHGQISAAQNDTRLIDRFLQTIAAEKAVSKHTLSAYHSDLYVVAAGLANLSSDTAAGGLQTQFAIPLQLYLMTNLQGQLPQRKDHCGRRTMYALKPLFQQRWSAETGQSA